MEARGANRAALVFDAGHLVVNAVGHVHRVVEGVLFARDVAKGVGGAYEGLVVAVGILGLVAEAIGLGVAQAVGLVLEQEDGAVGFNQFGHAAGTVVFVGADAAPGVGDAGCLAVQLVVMVHGITLGRDRARYRPAVLEATACAGENKSVAPCGGVSGILCKRGFS